jgi:flagellar hook assembly protein FlgD
VSAYPNPFNPRATITLDLPRAGEATLHLYDIRGRLVRTLHEGRLTEGRHDLTWAGADDAGRALASGVYFYELKVLGEERIGKLTLVR